MAALIESCASLPSLRMGTGEQTSHPARRLEAPDPPLDDGVVRLEPLRAEHIPAMRALGDDEDVARFTYVEAPLAEAEARLWVDRYIGGWRDGSLAGFAIAASDGGAFLGFIAVVRYGALEQEAELGYIVSPSARGRGIGVRALALLTTWCLGELGLERAELRIDVANEASSRVAEKAGYVREGILRSMHFKHGQRVDLALWSRVRRDA